MKFSARIKYKNQNMFTFHDKLNYNIVLKACFFSQ